jgi:hypothetical protein
VIAGLAGKISDRVAWGNRGQAAAADEIEAQGKKAASGKNVVAHEGRHMDTIFEGLEIDRTCWMGIVEGLPGKAGS